MEGNNNIIIYFHSQIIFRPNLQSFSSVRSISSLPNFGSFYTIGGLGFFWMKPLSTSQLMIGLGSNPYLTISFHTLTPPKVSPQLDAPFKCSSVLSNHACTWRGEKSMSQQHNSISHLYPLLYWIFWVSRGLEWSAPACLPRTCILHRKTGTQPPASNWCG